MFYFRALMAVFVVLCTSAISFAQDPAVQKYGQIPQTWSAEISPDGKKLAVGCAPSGVRAICLYSLDGSFGPRMIAAPEEADLKAFNWASDGYLLYYMDFFDKTWTSSSVVEQSLARALAYSVETEKSAVLMENIPTYLTDTTVDSLLIDDEDNVLMSITVQDEARAMTGSKLNTGGSLKHVLYEVSLKTGKAKVHDKPRGSIAATLHDSKGKRYAHIESELRKESYELVSYLDGKKTIFQREDVDLAPLSIRGLTADKTGVIVFFDDGEVFGLKEISLMDGEIKPFVLAGETLEDVGLITDYFTGTVLGYGYTDNLYQQVYDHPKLADYVQKLKVGLQAHSVTLTSWTKDYDMVVARAARYGFPAEYYLLDATIMELSPIGSEAPEIVDADVGGVKAVSYEARDGLVIPAYLTSPPGYNPEEGPLPLVALPHGGPEARDTAGYDWLAQAIASKGYLVLQPNFRGSSGYGKDFRDKGYGEFGGKMVLDVIDGAKWAIDEGHAAPDGFCVMGASYGGYSALMSTIIDSEMKPECVISINGVSDPFYMMTRYGRESGTFSYWEQYMGDFFKTSDEYRESISPLDRAGEIKLPVLLIHGREDTTVPVNQSEQMAEALERRSDSRFVKIKGDDHYLSSTESRQLVLAEVLAFLEEHHPVGP